MWVSRLHWVAVVFFAVALSGCGMKDNSAADVLRKYGLFDHPEPSRFDVCDRFGCRGFVRVSLDETEWSQVADILTPKADTPIQEREHIAQAVAQLELLVGAKIGTDVDIARNKAAGTGQLDCVSESVNTSVYLFMLQQRGLLAHHFLDSPRRRGTFIFFPHNTAVITEVRTGWSYAVDSWFGNNGDVPYMIPIQDWLHGWHPEDDPGTSAGDTEPVSLERAHGV